MNLKTAIILNSMEEAEERSREIWERHNAKEFWNSFRENRVELDEESCRRTPIALFPRQNGKSLGVTKWQNQSI